MNKFKAKKITLSSIWGYILTLSSIWGYFLTILGILASLMGNSLRSFGFLIQDLISWTCCERRTFRILPNLKLNSSFISVYWFASGIMQLLLAGDIFWLHGYCEIKNEIPSLSLLRKLIFWYLVETFASDAHHHLCVWCQPYSWEALTSRAWLPNYRGLCAAW